MASAYNLIKWLHLVFAVAALVGVLGYSPALRRQIALARVTKPQLWAAAGG